jgi:hypothetical protein
MDFFDRLYLGFEAEYYVMGQLFSAGYEGFKMPADFGFDILVTNQKEQSLNADSKKKYAIYHLLTLSKSSLAVLKATNYS